MANFFDDDVAKYTGAEAAKPSDQTAGATTTPAVSAAPNFFDADVNAATAPPALPPGQMTGWQREVALPASSFARGVVSTIGLPGDVVRLTGAIGGAAAEQAQNPDPLAAMRPPAPLTATPGGGPRILTNQLMFDAPGKPNLPAASWHNPLDTESLLGYPGISTIANPPSVQPQNLRERIEAAGAAGVGSAATGGLLTGGLSTVPTAARTLAQGAISGASGEVGGEVGEAVAGTPGRVVGTVLGGVTGAQMAPGGGGAAAFLPSGMDAETAALARRAQDLGINVSVGAASGSPFVKIADSQMRRLPFMGYGSYDDANQKALVRAVTNTFGEDAPKLTSDVINNAYGRIGPVFNNVGGRYNFPLTSSLDQRLADVSRLAGESGLDAGQTASLQAQVQKIRDIAAQNNGVIPGNVYVDLIKRGESLDLLQGSGSTTTGRLAGQIRDTLDDGLTSVATPQDRAALQQARTQYKALKTVEPLTLRADAAGGVTPSTGEVSPAALLGRVSQQYDNAARAQPGQIPLLDLARIGQRFLKEPPSSSTAERLGVMQIAKGVGSLGLGAAGLHDLERERRAGPTSWVPAPRCALAPRRCAPQRSHPAHHSSMASSAFIRRLRLGLEETNSRHDGGGSAAQLIAYNGDRPCANLGETPAHKENAHGAVRSAGNCFSSLSSSAARSRSSARQRPLAVARLARIAASSLRSSSVM